MWLWGHYAKLHFLITPLVKSFMNGETSSNQLRMENIGIQWCNTGHGSKIRLSENMIQTELGESPFLIAYVCAYLIMQHKLKHKTTSLICGKTS